MDRDAQLRKLQGILVERAHIRETVDNYEANLVPLKQKLIGIEASINQIILALYPSALPTLPQEHEGRAFRNENGELVTEQTTPEQTTPAQAKAVDNIIAEDLQTKPELTFPQTAIEPMVTAEAMKKIYDYYAEKNKGILNFKPIQPYEDTCLNCGDTIYIKQPTGIWYHVMGKKNAYCGTGISGKTATPGGSLGQGHHTHNWESCPNVSDPMGDYGDYHEICYCGAERWKKPYESYDENGELSYINLKDGIPLWKEQI